MAKRARITISFLLLALVFSSAGQKAERAAAQDARPRADVVKFLEDFAAAVDRLDSYTFIMDSRARKGRKKDNRISKFYFKKPNLLRTEVLKGRRRGSTVVLQGDGRIRGKNSFGIRMTLKPSDGKLKNVRGSTFLNASLADKSARINEQILDSGCAATLEEAGYEGRAAYRLHITHNGAYDDVTDEDLWVERESFLAIRDILYVGGEIVSDVTWSDYELNIPLDDKLFKL
jgi:outer membrane lipoprotein-sorting protein